MKWLEPCLMNKPACVKRRPSVVSSRVTGFWVGCRGFLSLEVLCFLTPGKMATKNSVTWISMDVLSKKRFKTRMPTVSPETCPRYS